MIQHLVVGGSAPPDPFGDEESNRQTDLCVRNQCLLARSFRAEGYAVVLDYVIGSADRLQTYLDLLPDEPVGLVVLTPSIDVARARDRERPDKHVLSGLGPPARADGPTSWATTGSGSTPATCPWPPR